MIKISIISQIIFNDIINYELQIQDFTPPPPNNNWVLYAVLKPPLCIESQYENIRLIIIEKEGTISVSLPFSNKELKEFQVKLEKNFTNNSEIAIKDNLDSLKHLIAIVSQENKRLNLEIQQLREQIKSNHNKVRSFANYLGEKFFSQTSGHILRKQLMSFLDENQEKT